MANLRAPLPSFQRRFGLAARRRAAQFIWLSARENQDYHPNAPHHCQMEDSLRALSLSEFQIDHLKIKMNARRRFLLMRSRSHVVKHLLCGLLRLQGTCRWTRARESCAFDMTRGDCVRERR